MTDAEFLNVLFIPFLERTPLMAAAAFERRCYTVEAVSQLESRVSQRKYEE